MKTNFKLQFEEADEGLHALRGDADRVANWLREKVRRKRLGGGKRPKGIAPTKKFDGHSYKFHSWYDNLVDAKEMSFAIRAGGVGRYCRIQEMDGFYLVYRGERI